MCRRRDDLPGLDELYLTTMDSIENITRADALYLLQGSALSATGARYGLSSGGGQESCLLPPIGADRLHICGVHAVQPHPPAQTKHVETSMAQAPASCKQVTNTSSTACPALIFICYPCR
jgi:hypothetical protein